MMCFSLCCGKKKASSTKWTCEVDEEFSGIQNTNLYTYGELRMATENFSPTNKLGQGGFGSVFKGKLENGTLAAIKVLSTESRQGVREFLTEINVIADMVHENLVKLYGCCVEGKHRILVYDFAENNSLAQQLLGGSHSSINFSWDIRRNICIGVAKGLTFLHEEVQPHIVHRDIKASNILLDKDLVPKIADFGLAKLFPEHVTHISTRVAGTEGYLAPEYALLGHLTRKADIYSFGVLLLEIVSGRSNTNRKLPIEGKYLLQRVWELHESRELVGLVDASLSGDLFLEEACKFLKIGLLCTQEKTKLRPSMSTALKMLMGEIDVSEMKISKPGLHSEFRIPKVGGSKEESEITSSSLSNSGNSPSLPGMDTSHATMTFNSIYDRSN